MDMSP